ncbi:MAG: RES family NAD+ phosphorylase [Gammaproteobacteria bacterium]|nr:RES family NAD+ phosphorylase [Gammaproteobacteria bacterium]
MPKVPQYPNLDTLDSTAPEWRSVEPGDELWRVYFRGGEHPSRWNQFRTFGPTDARFDHQLEGQPAKGRAIMYLALNPVTCLAEVFQKTRTIHRSHRKPALVGFPVTQPLKLLDLTGAFPTRVGASMGLMTGARSVSRNWARELYVAYPEAQGLGYPSSMHANAVAIVLNDRVDPAGALPDSPRFHKALDDPGMITLLKNAAREVGYVIR